MLIETYLAHGTPPLHTPRRGLLLLCSPQVSRLGHERIDQVLGMFFSLGLYESCGFGVFWGHFYDNTSTHGVFDCRLPSHV